MPELFNGEDVDLSAIYRDSAAPKDPDPADVLFGQLGQSIKPAIAPKATTAGAVAPQRQSGGSPTPRGGLLGPPTPIGPRPAGSSTAGPSADSTALLARLKPLGITNLNSLRSKSDVQLRQLSQDVVTYELRQQALNKYFKQNADGSYDFTVGPDGRPTGLAANGAKAGAAPAPATKPAPAAAPTVKPPAPKSAAKKASAPKRRTTKKRASTTRKRTTSRTRGTVPAGTKVTRPPVKTTTTIKPTIRRGLVAS